MTSTARGAFATSKNNALPWNPVPLMQEYLDEVSAGHSTGYARIVRVGLTHFATWMRAEGIRHPEELTRAHLIKFQAYVNSGGPDQTWSVSYQAQTLKYIRTFINWAASLEYITTNPWIKIKVPQINKKPKPLSDEEVALLFAAHRNQMHTLSPFSWHRQEMILAALYSWGMRVHELEALNVTNMDMRLDFVTARNKGGGTKTLPYSKEMKAVTRRWLAKRAQYSEVGEDSLLITMAGQRMGKEDISREISELGKRAGIEINAHRLRDTCGTHLLDDDVPVERVQRILGHANIRQTLAYSRVNDRTVADSHEASMDPRLAALLGDLSSTRTLSAN